MDHSTHSTVRGFDYHCHRCLDILPPVFEIVTTTLSDFNHFHHVFISHSHPFFSHSSPAFTDCTVLAFLSSFLARAPSSGESELSSLLDELLGLKDLLLQKNEGILGGREQVSTPGASSFHGNDDDEEVDSDIADGIESDRNSDDDNDGSDNDIHSPVRTRKRQSRSWVGPFSCLLLSLLLLLLMMFHQNVDSTHSVSLRGSVAMRTMFPSYISRLNVTVTTLSPSGIPRLGSRVVKCPINPSSKWTRVCWDR